MLTSNLSVSIPFSNVTNEHAVGAAGAACAVTLTAVDGCRRVLHGLQYSYSTTPTGGKLTVADGANTVFEIDIPAGGPGYVIIPIVGSINTDLVITLAAPGGAVVGKLNYQVTLVPA
jgi:hypothetical protein